MAGTPALWIRWHRDGRPTSGSVAHLVAGALRADQVPEGTFPLACGRFAPEGMTASIEVTATGWTARPCLRCLARWTPPPLTR